MIISCCKDKSTPGIFVEPDLSFSSNDSVYKIPYQNFGGELKYYVNTIAKPGDVIFGYNVNFSSGNSEIRLYFQQRYIIDLLDNENTYFKGLENISIFEPLDTSKYNLSQNEFESMFVVGEKKINQTGYLGTDGGVIVAYQEFQKDCYLSSDYHLAKSKDNYFDIEEFKAINKSDLNNTDKNDLDISPEMFNDATLLYLVKVRFSLTLEDSVTSNTMNIKDGHATFVVYY